MVIQAVAEVEVQKMCYYSHQEGRHMHAAKCASGGAWHFGCWALFR